jgi:hypothetical protein
MKPEELETVEQDQCGKKEEDRDEADENVDDELHRIGVQKGAVRVSSETP